MPPHAALRATVSPPGRGPQSRVFCLAFFGVFPCVPVVLSFAFPPSPLESLREKSGRARAGRGPPCIAPIATRCIRCGVMRRIYKQLMVEDRRAIGVPWAAPQPRFPGNSDATVFRPRTGSRATFPSAPRPSPTAVANATDGCIRLPLNSRKASLGSPLWRLRLDSESTFR
jgi:hypothetical protein